MAVSTQLPETLHTSAVQGLESSQSAAEVQLEQLSATWVAQTPASQVSVVHGSPSLHWQQRAGHAAGNRLGEQTWLEQVSVVQALSSLAQSAAVVQGMQPPSVRRSPDARRRWWPGPTPC
jgi:hypothetical protein